MHTVKEVKAWGDPSVVVLSSSASIDDDEDDNDNDNDVSSLGDDVVMGGTETGKTLGDTTRESLQHTHLAYYKRGCSGTLSLTQSGESSEDWVGHSCARGLSLSVPSGAR